VRKIAPELTSRIYGPKDRNIAKDLFFSLYALQHRGQEGAGIAVVSKQDNLFTVSRGMGLVMQVRFFC
jgi:amidophosphoribosyltransferase